ncbi:MAG TPA: heme biosynthesis HemY N-terminal domain-containing protein [Bradyrhizobium sp.]|uniref:heme biosynthesis protein HemY n=1 Tax=Bradyrhizobium sp. TaxID=376 RepID=UPI002B459B6E|nr:heme biosynthesis HemY N-terminal domain-containing protein [Bradyrhizobium sp.]HKO72126.1 heme biosynthesis HemY N-terminal domain-containing protein [Bradyrhizobium sp.]
MYRIVVFLLLIAAAAAGAAWIADQSGNVMLSWDGWRLETSLPVFALALGVTIVAATVVWSILRGLWRAPQKLRRSRRERRLARGRHAITHGLLAIGHGDAAAARAHADAARRHAANDPLALLLHAQSAQLEGDRETAKDAFRAMAEREETRLLGLRGLFIEAQRADDPVGAVMIAEEALKLAPASTWASHAVLGFRCARGDWNGALAILDTNLSSGLIDKPAYRRQRGVLLTARALELENVDRDRSRDSVMEAIKLAPTLVPAAVLASKYESEAHQVRRAMRIVETAWLAQPHPDLADAYAHVRLGDSARQRLVRIETLAAKAPGHLESALAVARAAIDASEFARAREALAPFIAAPTQRVAMLMAEIERNEHGDSGRARAWTLRAVRALHDPVWTADGYVSDRWRPVSPVSGRLDAFQWQTPLAALPSEKNAAIETAEFNELTSTPLVEPPREPPLQPVTAQDNSPLNSNSQSHSPPNPAEIQPAAASPAASAPVQAEAETVTAAPLFRQRHEMPKSASPSVPPVIPIVRPPDDPGIDDEPAADEFAERLGPSQGQAGGWRGFLSRWGG